MLCNVSSAALQSSYAICPVLPCSCMCRHAVGSGQSHVCRTMYQSRCMQGGQIANAQLSAWQTYALLAACTMLAYVVLVDRTIPVR